MCRREGQAKRKPQDHTPKAGAEQKTANLPLNQYAPPNLPVPVSYHVSAHHQQKTDVPEYQGSSSRSTDRHTPTGNHSS